MSKRVPSKTPSSCVVIEKYCDSHNQRSALHFLRWCLSFLLLAKRAAWQQHLAPQGVVEYLVILHPTSALLNHNLHFTNIPQVIHIQIKACLFKQAGWSMEWLILP